MLNVLLPVDGSECSIRATEKLVEMLGRCNSPPQIDLLAVHLPVPRFPNMSLVISDEMIQRYYDEECGRILAPSRAVLDAAGAKYAVHRRIGPIAENIVEQAKQAQSDLICMGTRGMTPLANMVLGSVANRVLHLARIPVLLVH